MIMIQANAMAKVLKMNGDDLDPKGNLVSA